MGIPRVRGNQDNRRLMAKGADVNAKHDGGKTPLDNAIKYNADDTETVDTLRKHGGKKGEELKAEGK
jgi:ankyrin repeat protein